MNFVAESVNTRTPKVPTRFMNLALNARNAYVRALTLVVGLLAQSEGQVRVIVEADL